jgi:signal transduction histidine kinase
LDVIDDAVSLVGPSFRLKRVRLQWDRPEDATLWIQGDFVGLSQVFVNLLTNGRDAAATARGLSDAELEAKAHVEVRVLQQDTFVSVEVHDSGPGVPHELRNRIFEPYFTTKAIGEGTGLGLPLVKKTVAAHQGQIEVRQSCFVVTLPLTGVAESELRSSQKKIA